ncbi:MAG: hypothetical protein GEV12_19795 [Micromonosporaceae bacterium]|nr:hypothetical protein [Micromonosporaceae bacterium]
MTRLTIAMDERLAEAVKAAAGDNVSAWMSRLARQEIVRQAVAAEVAHDQRDPAWRGRVAEHTREIDAPA